MSKLLSTMEKQEIIKAYSNYVLDKNRRPESMYIFAKELNIEEAEIYEQFTGFSQIEEEIINHFIQNSIDLTLNNSKDEETGSKEKLLTFYFTLVEVFKMNRSLVNFILPIERGELIRFKPMKRSKKTFLSFLNSLKIEAPALSFIPNMEFKDKAIATGAWIQFCSIVFYWLKDSSSNFEKTDIFIEKSLRLSFDLKESSVMESFIDFGKFMFNKS